MRDLPLASDESRVELARKLWSVGAVYTLTETSSKQSSGGRRRKTGGALN